MPLIEQKKEYFRDLLLSRQDSLLQGLKQATAELVEEEVPFPDPVDQASAEMDRSFLVQMNNRDRSILLQIKAALRRIDRGVFGQCENCFSEINDARLEVFPFTTLCIDCKAEIESEEQRFPNRH